MMADDEGASSASRQHSRACVHGSIDPDACCASR